MLLLGSHGSPHLPSEHTHHSLLGQTHPRGSGTGQLQTGIFREIFRLMFTGSRMVAVEDLEE